MKKAVIIFLVSLLIILGTCVGAFAIRFYAVDNGKIALRGTSLVAIADVGYEFESWSSGETEESISIFPLKNLFKKPNFVYKTLDFPIISISTENSQSITSKEKYLNCTVSVSGTEYTLDEATARIKGRGNSTFAYDKKPYKIKFDEKTSLLGEAEAKEWTLIANHMDYSLMRNYLVYTVAASLNGLKYTTSVSFADVYVNGEYRGLYTVCEQIEAGKNRVDIEDSLDVDETGYLIELDSRAPDEGVCDRDYFYSKAPTPPYAIKSPDTEDEKFTADRVAFIKAYVDRAYDALISGNYTEVEKYLDVESFVDGYILDELFTPVDIGFSSFYMYKDSGGKLSRGPVWDYDLSSGNTESEMAETPTAIYAGIANAWYAGLLRYPEFRAALSLTLDEKSEEISEVISSCFDFAQNHKNAFLRNFEMWDILGEYSMPYTSEEVCEIDTLSGQWEYLREWLAKSLEFLNSQYS